MTKYILALLVLLGAAVVPADTPTSQTSCSQTTASATPCTAAENADCGCQAPASTAVASPLTGFFTSFWKLADTSDSIGTNTLTNNGGATFVAGKIGNAASLDSVVPQWLSVADNTSLTFTNKLTIALWVKVTGSLAALRTPIGKWTYQTDGEYAVSTSGTGSDLTVFIATAANDSGTGCQMSYNAGLALNTYALVVVVFDGTQTGNANRLKMYVNNVEKTQTVVAGNVPAALLNGGAPFNIGKFGGSLNRPWSGEIDAVGIAGNVPTQAQLDAMWNGGTGVEPPF